MKGLSSFLKVIGLVIVVVIVLAVLSTFLLVSTRITGINDQNAWNDGCRIAIARGCELKSFQNVTEGGGLFVSNYDPNGDDPLDPDTKASKCGSSTLKTEGCGDNTLRSACKSVYGLKSAADCQKKCCDVLP